MDRVVKVDPYIRISRAEQYENAAHKVCYRKEAPIFLQGGQYYTEDGKPVLELPEWAKEEISKLGPKALEETGFMNPKRRRQEAA